DVGERQHQVAFVGPLVGGGGRREPGGWKDGHESPGGACAQIDSLPPRVHTFIVSRPEPGATPETPKRRKKKRKSRFSVLRVLAMLVLCGSILGGSLLWYGYREFSRDLPQRLDVLTNYQPQTASRVYSADGELIGEFYLERRVVVPYSAIPPNV